MNRVRVVLAILLIFGGMFAQLNSEYIQNRLESNVTNDENSLIPIQEEEEWLVLKIEFIDSFFDNSLLSDFFEPFQDFIKLFLFTVTIKINLFFNAYYTKFIKKNP